MSSPAYAVVERKDLSLSSARATRDREAKSEGGCDRAFRARALHERTKIYRNKDEKITYEEAGKTFQVPDNSKVSMNFWCFGPSVFPYIGKLFAEFLREQGTNPKAEFFIPIIGDKVIQEGKGAIKVIPTGAQWFGVTYKEDAPDVQKSLNKLIENGEYPSKLWN